MDADLVIGYGVTDGGEHIMLTRCARPVVFMACLLTTCGVRRAEAASFTFTDTFEAATLNAFWTLTQQNGNIQLSTSQSQSGSQSVKVTGTGGGQVNVWLSHLFSPATEGTLSVGFYDGGPGIYAGLYAFDSASGSQYSVDVADYDPTTWVWIGGQAAHVTAIPRTGGWHTLGLTITSSGFQALLDSAVIGSMSGSFTFDDVLLLVSGPSESGTFYFDNFSVVTRDAATVPEPASIVLLGTGLAAVVARRRSAKRT